MKRCPVCFGFVNKKATKCKHCSSDIGEDNEYFKYINNGFALIDKECEDFNQKAESVRGSFFPKHQYSEEELLHSSHLEKIKTIVGKMGNDIENWQNRGAVSLELKSYYEEKIDMLNDRFQFMIRRLKTRKYNVWERISEFFICSYYFIINIALHHIKNMIIPYIRSSDKVMKPFTVLQRTAEHFEHFLDKVHADTRTDIMGNLSNSRES